MSTKHNRVVKRIAIWSIAAYLFGVVLTLTINGWWKTYFGVESGWSDILECIYGPAITISSGLLLWLGIFGLLDSR